MINQCKLFDDMRIVWLKHVWWTREVILAIAAGAPWTADSVAKLLENPHEMADVFAPFITPAQKQQMTDLFVTHLKLGGAVVTAAKNKEIDKLNDLQKQWHENADQIARFMADLGLGYVYEEVKQMMYSHLRLTTHEAVFVLEGKFAQSITEFERVQNEALMMADYFTNGIRKTKLSS